MQELAESIRELGLLNPVTLDDDAISSSPHTLSGKQEATCSNYFGVLPA